MFTATIRVTGVGRLADFRERLRFLMVRDGDAEPYTEPHTPEAVTASTAAGVAT